MICIIGYMLSQSKVAEILTPRGDLESVVIEKAFLKYKKDRM